MSRSGNNLKRKPRASLSTQNRNYGFIQQNSPIEDERGTFVDDWQNTSVNQHAMGILPRSSQQVFEEDSINVEVTHIITMRAEIPVTELNRIVSDSIIYEILSIDDIQSRGIVNWIFCKERRD